MTEKNKEGFLKTFTSGAAKTIGMFTVATTAFFVAPQTAEARPGPGYVATGMDGHGITHYSPVNSNPHGIAFYHTGPGVTWGGVGPVRGGFVGGPARFVPPPHHHHHHHNFWHNFGRDVAWGAGVALGGAIVDTVVGGSTTYVVPGAAVAVPATTYVAPATTYVAPATTYVAPATSATVVEESKGILGWVSDWWNGPKKAATPAPTQVKTEVSVDSKQVEEARKAAARAEAAAAAATNAATKAEASAKAAKQSEQLTAAYTDFVSKTVIKLKTKPAVSTNVTAKVKERESHQ